MEDGKCECYDDVEGVTFLGPHCEVRLKDECRTIYGGEFIIEMLFCDNCFASDRIFFLVLMKIIRPLVIA